jgi:hypothetical protein
MILDAVTSASSVLPFHCFCQTPTKELYMNCGKSLSILWLAQAFVWTAAAQAQAVGNAPDLILRNGHIFTGETSEPWAAAISIRGNTVLATGTDAAISATAGKQTQVIDLHGRMAMPGINDAHDHVGGASYGVEAVTKHPPQSNPPIAELADAVRTAAATARPGEWIHAFTGKTVITNPKLTGPPLTKWAAAIP